MIEHIGKYRRYINNVVPDQGYFRTTVEVQVIVSDGGPWAEHNVACAVCGDDGAILDLSRGVFMPCDKCTKKGWSLKQKTRWWRRRA